MEPLAIVINNVTQQVTLGYYTDPKYIKHLKYYFREALLLPQNTNSVSASFESWCIYTSTVHCVLICKRL